MPADTETTYKWQPVVLIIDKRLDCGKCGAAAVFVEVDTETRPDGDLAGLSITAYCQPCFAQAEEEAERRKQQD